MQAKRNALPALPRGKGKCEKCVPTFVRNLIVPQIYDFVQWVTGLLGCTVFWSHGILWLVHLEPFNAPAFALGALMIAVSAVMEVHFNEKV